MAETTEKSILIDVNLSTDEAIKQTVRLKEEIVKLNEKKSQADKTDLELMAKYEAELKALNAEKRSWENITQKQIQAQNIQNNTIEKARLALSVVSAQWAKMTLIYGENSEEVKKLAAEKLRLTEIIKAEERATGDARRNVGNYPFAFIQEGWFKITAGITGAFMAAKTLASTFASTLNVIKDFQTASNELSAITGVTGSGLKALENAAIEMSVSVDASGNKINKSANEILLAFQKVGSAKPELLENSEALKEVTKNAIILSQAGGRNLPLDDAVKALTQTMNQFNAPAEESGRYINVLAAGAKFGAGEIPYLNEAMIKAGTTASNAGMSIEQTAAALEIFAEKGLTAEIAGTGFKTLLIKLQGDTKNYTNGVFDLNKAIQNNANIADSSAAIAKKFGLEQVNVATILFKNEEKLNKLTAAMTGTNTAFEQSQTNTKGLAFNMQQLNNKWDALILSIDNGDGFLGKTVSLFTNLASSIISVITPTNSLVDSMANEQMQMNLLVNEITNLNEGNLERDRLIKELKDKYPTFINLIGDEKISNDELKKALESVNNEYQKKIAFQTGKETYQKEIENLNKLKADTEVYKQQLSIIASIQQAMLKDDKDLLISLRNEFNRISKDKVVLLGFTPELIESAKKDVQEYYNEAINAEKIQNSKVLSEQRKVKTLELQLFYQQLTETKVIENEKSTYKKLMMQNFIDAFKAGNMSLAEANKRYIDNYKEVTVKGKKDVIEVQSKEEKKAAHDAAKLAKEDLDRKLKNLDYAIDIEKRKNKGLINESELYDESILNIEKERLIKSAKKQQDAIKEKMDLDSEHLQKYKHESTIIEIELDEELKKLDEKNKKQKLDRQLKHNKDIEEAAKKTAEIEKLILESKYDAAKNFSSAIVDITKTMYGEESEIAKAAGFVQIAVDTYVGSMKAWTSAQSLSYPYNLIAGASAVAATIAQGIVQTEKLMSVNKGSSLSSSGNTSSGNRVTNMAPSSMGYQNPTNINSGIIAQNTVIDKRSTNNVTTTAVVVDDVTNKQMKQTNTEKLGVI